MLRGHSKGVVGKHLSKTLKNCFEQFLPKTPRNISYKSPNENHCEHKNGMDFSVSRRLPKIQQASPYPTGKPNILFSVADDAGLDMSAYGCTWVKTPAFDRIAREGAKFLAKGAEAIMYGKNQPIQSHRNCLLFSNRFTI